MLRVHALPGSLTVRDTAEPPSPPARVLDRVAAIWERERQARPELFDGSLFSLDRIADGTAHGWRCPYSWYLAQLVEPDLYGHLRVRSLAVSGLCLAGNHLVFGRRNERLHLEGGMWELAPSGGIHGGLREPDGSISLFGQFREELREELGLRLKDDARLSAFAFVEDTETRICDVGIAAGLPVTPEELVGLHGRLADDEYTELALVPKGRVRDFLKARRDAVIGVSRCLLSAFGLA